MAQGCAFWNTTVELSRNKADYGHWKTIPPRYSDQDPMLHINNVATCAYFEAGRLTLLEEILQACKGSDVGMVLAKMSIDFTHELSFPDDILVGGKLVSAGNRSLVSHYAIFQHDQCCALSLAVNVFFNKVTRQSAVPPEAASKIILARLGEF